MIRAGKLADMPVLGYELQINDDEIRDVGLVNTCKLTGLEPDTIYRIQIRSYDVFGRRSEWTAIFTETAHENPTVQRLSECNRALCGMD
jgi:hypothetical protein